MSRRATPELARLVGDLAAGYLASKGRGARLDALAGTV